MRNFKETFLLIFLTLLTSFHISARSYDPDELAMPNLMAGEYIADPENLLSTSTRSQVNHLLNNVRAQTTAEVGVAIVPDLGDMDIEEYSNKLYDLWKIGKADNSNGVLLIISPGSRQARIQTGYGTEGVIPDAVADRIMRHQIIPAMRNGDLDAAVSGASEEIARILTDPEYADELKSAQKGYGTQTEGLSAEDKEALKSAFYGLASIIFVAGGITLIFMWRSNRKNPRQKKILSYRNMVWILIALGLLSLGSGLIWSLIGWLIYRKARNTADPCPNCGNTGRRHLTGNEASIYLTPAQQTETRLKSRNHDVWKCDQCGEVTVDSMDNPFSNYTECDKCGTKAMHIVENRTLVHALPNRKGVGERVYRCEHCGNERRERYIINRDVTAAALGAAALGAARHSGRGGGGFGGFGGFGGGSSGGGGASGRW